MTYAEKALKIADRVEGVIELADKQTPDDIVVYVDKQLQLAQIYATLALKEELEKRVKVNWV